MDIDIYTDGACSGNPGTGGWAFVIMENSDEKEIATASGACADTTNNRMELLAAIEALKKIKSIPLMHGDILGNDLKIEIYTDSRYVMDGISKWIFNWKKNNWKTASKQPVKNQDLWQNLDRLSQEFSPSWNWVKGHSGNKYNEQCDRLAVQAISQFKI